MKPRREAERESQEPSSIESSEVESSPYSSMIIDPEERDRQIALEEEQEAKAQETAKAAQAESESADLEISATGTSVIDTVKLAKRLEDEEKRDREEQKEAARPSSAETTESSSVVRSAHVEGGIKEVQRKVRERAGRGNKETLSDQSTGFNRFVAAVTSPFSALASLFTRSVAKPTPSYSKLEGTFLKLSTTVHRGFAEGKNDDEDQHELGVKLGKLKKDLLALKASEKERPKLNVKQTATLEKMLKDVERDIALVETRRELGNPRRLSVEEINKKIEETKESLENFPNARSDIKREEITKYMQEMENEIARRSTYSTAVELQKAERDYRDAQREVKEKGPDEDAYAKLVKAEDRVTSLKDAQKKAAPLSQASAAHVAKQKQEPVILSNPVATNPEIKSALTSATQRLDEMIKDLPKDSKGQTYDIDLLSTKQVVNIQQQIKSIKEQLTAIDTRQLSTEDLKAHHQALYKINNLQEDLSSGPIQTCRQTFRRIQDDFSKLIEKMSDGSQVATKEQLDLIRFDLDHIQSRLKGLPKPLLSENEQKTFDKMLKDIAKQDENLQDLAKSASFQQQATAGNS